MGAHYVWREQIDYVCFSQYPCQCFYLAMDKTSIFAKWWSLPLCAFLECSSAAMNTYGIKSSCYILKPLPVVVAFVCSCIICHVLQVWLRGGAGHPPWWMGWEGTGLNSRWEDKGWEWALGLGKMLRLCHGDHGSEGIFTNTFASNPQWGWLGGWPMLLVFLVVAVPPIPSTLARNVLKKENPF